MFYKFTNISVIFSFLDASRLFSIVAVSIYIPTNSPRGIIFTTPSLAFIVCRFYNDGCSDRCEVIPHCSFDLHLPNNWQWRRQWQPTPVLLPGKSHGWRSLVGFSPWGREESDMTEWLHFYFSLSCTGEGNGNPLQCSCLENPRDGRAWCAAIYGVAQSRTRLKWLSSSSSNNGQNSPFQASTVLEPITSRYSSWI